MPRALLLLTLTLQYIFAASFLLSVCTRSIGITNGEIHEFGCANRGARILCASTMAANHGKTIKICTLLLVAAHFTQSVYSTRKFRSERKFIITMAVAATSSECYTIYTVYFCIVLARTRTLLWSHNTH